MHTLKLPILCLLLFLLFSAEKCEQANGEAPKATTEEPAAIELLSAKSMNWVAGIKDGGSGTEYNFRVVVTTDKPLAFSAVSINGEKREHAVSKRGTAVSSTPLEIAQHDTLDVHVSTETNKEKAKALLEYTVNGQEQQMAITEIEMLETQNRP